jgi:hypothetical protein
MYLIEWAVFAERKRSQIDKAFVEKSLETFEK